MVYWSERSTFADGYIHSSERLCHLAIPFATDNIRLSANYLSFLSHHGTNGVKKFSNLVNLPYTKSFILLRKLLEKSPDEALDSISLILQENNLPSDKLSNIMSFLYPNKEKDIYLFIDKNFISQGILSWINFYGTWDVLKKTGGLSLPHVNFSIEHDYEKLYSNTRGLQIDKNTGAMTYENLFIEPISLQSIRIYNTNLNQIPLIKDTLIYSTAQEQIHLNEFAFNNIFNPTVNSTKGEYFLDIFPVNNIAYLMDKNIANMVARKLFFHVYNPTHINDYFTLIDEDFLNYQLWRINPDKIKN